MSIQITGPQLIAIGGRGGKNVDALAAAFNEYAPRFGLDREQRAEHFFAQLAHESGGFKYDREIWGPTAAQRRYEGRKDLGNVVAGDGSKFRGYGPIQITGRANVTEFYRWCLKNNLDCPDFVTYPHKIAEMPWGLLAAFWFWETRGLNAYADKNDLSGITKRINGGYNGLADRRYRYGLAVRAIIAGAAAVPPPAVKDAKSRPTLRKGSKDEAAVRQLQTALNALYADDTDIAVDGDFGEQTQAFVIAFQRANDLLPDGAVGGLTWAALDKATAAS